MRACILGTCCLTLIACTEELSYDPNADGAEAVAELELSLEIEPNLVNGVAPFGIVGAPEGVEPVVDLYEDGVLLGTRQVGSDHQTVLWGLLPDSAYAAVVRVGNVESEPLAFTSGSIPSLGTGLTATVHDAEAMSPGLTMFGTAASRQLILCRCGCVGAPPLVSRLRRGEPHSF